FIHTQMKRTLARETLGRIGEEVNLKGWLHNFRNLGKIGFLVLRDRSGYIQIVVESKDDMKQLASCQVGSILSITGTISEAKTDLGVELVNPSIEVVTRVSEAMPIDITKPTINAELETILDYRPITLRHQRSQAIFRIQATMVQAYREFLTEEGFTEFFG